jgi:hypothetical protein
MNRLIDRKVDHKDLKAVIDNKADKTDFYDKFALKTEYDLVRDSINEILLNIQNKVNNQDFIHF